MAVFIKKYDLFTVHIKAFGEVHLLLFVRLSLKC